MGFELDAFDDLRLDADYLEWLVDVHAADIHRHFSRLWDYYANPMVDIAGSGAVSRKVHESGRPYVQAQEYGLPSRITGLLHSPTTGAFDSRIARDIQRKEVVVENDIAWRVNAAADFLFGKPVRIVSKALGGRIEPRQRALRSGPITLRPGHRGPSPAHTKSERWHVRLGPSYARLGRSGMELHMTYLKLDPAHIKLGLTHSKLDPAHFKLGLPHLKLDPSHLKLGLPHLKLDPSHIKLDLPHWKLDPGHFKLGLPHLKLDLPHIKSTPSQIKRPLALRKSL